MPCAWRVSVSSRLSCEAVQAPNLAIERRPSRDALLARREVLAREPVLAARGVCEGAPLLLRLAGDADPLVLARAAVDAVRREVAVRVADGPGVAAVPGVVDHRLGQAREARLALRQLDELAAPRARSRGERGEDRERPVGGGDRVQLGGLLHHRPVLRVAVEALHPEQPRQRRAVAHEVRPWPVEACRGHRQHDQPRVLGRQARVVDAERAHHPRRVVVDDHVDDAARGARTARGRPAP